MKSTYFWTATACFFLICLFRYPAALLAASEHSLSLWLHTVFPSLFPFLTVTGILYGLGAAQKMGRLFQPLMKPVFRLSGICAFPLFLGIVSGYPIGAKLTVQLYENHEISLSEAKKILAFCNHPGPLFLIGTVGTGFFGNPVWGYGFFICTIFSTILMGLLVRPLPAVFLPAHSDKALPQKSSFSRILSQSIQDALITTAQIGGYIVFFGAFSEALSQVGFFCLLGKLSSVLPCSISYIQALGSGILEMTNGAAQLGLCPDSEKLRIISAFFLLSFGGCSILGQTLDILSPVPISPFRYTAYQIGNGIISAGLFFLSYTFWEKQAQKAVPVFSSHTETALSPWLFLFFLLLFLGSFLLSRKRKN